MFVLTIGDGVLQYLFNNNWSFSGMHFETIIIGALSATGAYVKMSVLKNSKGELGKEPTKTEYKP